jgi:RNA polymerase-binding transcription factor DksA
MLEETRLAFRGEDPLSRCDDDAYRKLIPIADPMGIKRLTALPHALYCVRCQEGDSVLSRTYTQKARA